MIKFFSKYKYSSKVLFIYNLVIVLIVLGLYFTIPVVMNYLPETINTPFDVQMSFISYTQQILSIMIIFLVITNTLLLILLKNIFKLEKEMYINSQWTDNSEVIKKARKDCYRIPYVIYAIQILLAIIIVIGVLISTGSHDGIMVSKIALLVMSFDILATVMSFVFSKKYFTQILTILPYDEDIGWKNISIRKKILLMIFPMLIMAISFTSLIGYSRVINEKGNVFHSAYSVELNKIPTEGLKDLEIHSLLSEIPLINKGDNRVIIYNNGEYKSLDNKEVSNFIVEYTIQISNKYDGKIMDSYGKDIQGVMKKIYNEDLQEYCYVGVIYELSSLNSLIFLLIAFILEVIFNIIVLKSVADDIGDGISLSLTKLEELADKKYNFKDRVNSLKVVTNDEMGELAIAFNRIQNVTNEYINEIHENQETIIEQDRLASLGQLIGGVAHNLKTPIMSISGNLQGLQDLITEYDASIGDDEVTNEDHKDIAKDMQELVDKTRIHLSYMSDVITAVKGQAVQLDSSQEQIFSATEVVSRIEILMRHELKNALVEMKSTVSDEAKVAYIKGDINSLVQVLNNFIQNAIYAYKGKSNQTIYLDVSKNENKLCFKIQDYGCGIPDNVKAKLFKEMITTKGKNGTGLGLYMSYSTIKGKFGGGLEFESEVGKGTTFYITIPISE